MIASKRIPPNAYLEERIVALIWYFMATSAGRHSALYRDVFFQI
jgi:hypothetical protein